MEIDLNGENNYISVYFRNVKGPFDDMLQWPIPWKSYSFILLINDKEASKATSESTDDGGKWKDHFKRPNLPGLYNTSGKCLGYGKCFEHELIENVTDNDKVVIKFDMEF